MPSALGTEGKHLYVIPQNYCCCLIQYLLNLSVFAAICLQAQVLCTIGAKGVFVLVGSGLRCSYSLLLLLAWVFEYFVCGVFSLCKLCTLEGFAEKAKMVVLFSLSFCRLIDI